MISIFVSSTFQDMQAERDILQLDVLPALARQARRYGRQVMLTDLRWGVNTVELESQEGSRKVLRACLREIDRCRPYMIVLLGERYGWVPEEDLMRSTLQEEVAFRAAEGEDLSHLLDRLDKSVTELEIEYGALLLEGRCFFYFRDPLPEEEMTPKQRDVFLAASEEDRQRMKALKQRILDLVGSERVRGYTAEFDGEKGVVGLKGFADQVRGDLSKQFEREWGEPLPEDSVQGSALAYWSESQAMAEAFVGREETIQAVMAFLSSETERLLLLSGAEGSGKSMLMAQLVQQLDARDGTFVIPFLCGYDRRSVLPEDLLIHCILQMRTRFQRHGGEEPTDAEEYGRKIAGYSRRELQAIAASTAFKLRQETGDQVVLCIDGLERLEEAGADWIPIPMDKGLKIILSAPSGYWENSPHRGRERVSFMPIGELSLMDRQEAVRSAMRLHHKEMLPPSVLETVMAKPLSGNALYLSLLLQRFVMFDQSDFDQIQQDRVAKAAQGVTEDGQMAILRYMQAVAEALPDTLPQLCAELYSMAGSRISKELCDAIGALLAMSSNGWRETDIRGMCVELGMRWNPLNFALLRLYLAPFFTERGEGRIAFSHASIQAGIRDTVQEPERYQKAILQWLKKLPKDDPLRWEELPRFLLLRRDQRGVADLLISLAQEGAPDAARRNAAEALFQREEDAEWLAGASEEWAGTDAGLFILRFAAPYLLKQRRRLSVRNLTEVLRSMLDALEAGEIWREGTLLLAQSYEAMGMPEYAARLYQALLERDGQDDAGLWHAAGQAYAAAGRGEDALAHYRRAVEIWEAQGVEHTAVRQGLVRAWIAMAEYETEDCGLLLERATEAAEALYAQEEIATYAALVCQSFVTLAEWHVFHGEISKTRRSLFRPMMLVEILQKWDDGLSTQLLRARMTLCMGDLEMAQGDEFPAMLFYTEAYSLLVRLVQDTQSPECRDALAGCLTRMLPVDGYEEFTRERCIAEAKDIWTELFQETGNHRFLRLAEAAPHRSALRA